jgi:hypothetical protein
MPMSKVDAQQNEEVAEKPEYTLGRLIAEQGVTSVDDLDQLAALWPADDDPDALMNFVLSERRARGQLKPEDQQSK